MVKQIFNFVRSTVCVMVYSVAFICGFLHNLVLGEERKKSEVVNR